jgi:predicted nicotinamide N-methyase
MPGYQTKFETIAIGDSNYRIRSLRDKQQYSDPLGTAADAGVSSASWPLFGHLWPAGIILADLMDRHRIDGLRILEIGCGLALASLVISRRGADITASDYHPLAHEFLDHNVALNGFPAIPFVLGDWSKTHAALGKFDLIIGSDILYEPDHPGLLANFIHCHANADVEVIIIDPDRGRHSKLSNAMDALGYQCSREKIQSQLALELCFKGHRLTFEHHLNSAPTS